MFFFYSISYRLEISVCPRPSGASLHGLWGVPPSCLQQEPSAVDLWGQLGHLRGERRGYGPGEVCGESGWYYCVLLCLCTWSSLKEFPVLSKYQRGLDQCDDNRCQIHFWLQKTNVAFGTLPILHLRHEHNSRLLAALWPPQGTKNEWVHVFMSSVLSCESS